MELSYSIVALFHVSIPFLILEQIINIFENFKDFENIFFPKF